MQIIKKRNWLVIMLILISLSASVKLNAQTPADDPGIGGPGTSGSSPEGDGAPIVPFDSNMNLLFLGSTILLVAKIGKDKGLLRLQN